MRQATNQELSAEFLAQLVAARGLSAHTVLAYQRELVELNSLLDSVPGVQLQALTELQVRQYVAQVARAGLGPRSIARRLSAWRVYYDWLAQRNLVHANPVRAVRAPRAARRLPKALSPDDTRDFLEAGRLAEVQVDHSAAVTARDQAMLELFYSSGLRLAELVSLDWRHMDQQSTSWIDLQEAQVTVLGKGRKTRQVPIGKTALAALATWLDLRQTAAPPARLDSRALFVACSGARLGQRLSARAVQERVRQRSVRSGIAANVHPHVLRHSFASHVLQSSGDLRAVQDMLGHANITTTQVYTSLDFQRLAAVYDQAHPRARVKNAVKNKVKQGS